MNKDFGNCYNRKKTGYNIISLMHEHEMTQEALAKLIRVSPRCIRYWISGESSISVDNAFRMCNVFKITMEQLFVFD